MVKLNQVNFNKLIEIFNHNMTEMKTDLKWMKRFMYMMVSGMFSAVGLLAKIAFF